MNRALTFDPGALVSTPRRAAEPLFPTPMEWRRGLAKLAERPTPRHLAEERWAQIVADATKIATVWCAEVVEAGWTIENLFGLDREGYEDCLALRLRGRTMVRIDAQCASLKTANGYRLHYPKIAQGSPLLWSFDARKVPVA